MCYSGLCEFEDHMGDCRLRSHKRKEYMEWAKYNGFSYCGFGLDEEEYFERKLWIFNNKEKLEYFKKEFVR